MQLKNDTNKLFKEMFNKSAHKAELLEHPSFQYLLEQAIKRRLKEDSKQQDVKSD